MAAGPSRRPRRWGWLCLPRRLLSGLVAQFGQMITGGSADGSADSTGRVPDRLAVVRVETGESLHDVAVRVAPNAPTRQVADRIRELNGLQTPALAVGQTLIAPVG